jgi:hypothetical protein
LTARVANSVDDVSRWMSANRLQLDVDKLKLVLGTTVFRGKRNDKFRGKIPRLTAGAGTVFGAAHMRSTT